jgi:glycosyltransferase involved in cell wall biosynthesis
LEAVEFPICVLIASYNNMKNTRYKLPLTTTFRQEYSNYNIVYIDDASSDDTALAVRDYVWKRNFDPKRFTLIRNKKNKGPPFTEYHAALHHCQPDSITLILDGDDGLVGTQTLKLFNHFYQTKDKWLVYGNYIFTIGLPLIGCSNYIPKEILQNGSYRDQTAWSTSHPKSFYN